MIKLISDISNLYGMDNVAFQPLKELFNKNNNISFPAHIRIQMPLRESRTMHTRMQERNLKWMLE